MRAMAIDIGASFAIADDQPRALELGWGLMEGWDPTLFQPLLLVNIQEEAITGIAFSTCDGRVEWGPVGVISGDLQREQPWMADDAPAGAGAIQGEDGLNWSTAHPPPGGKRAHVAENRGGAHQHFFDHMDARYVKPDEKVYCWVYLDPQHPPTEVMLQFFRQGSWEHRAYWGANNIGWGADGTTARHFMGPLPKPGGWVRLEVPAAAANLH